MTTPDRDLNPMELSRISVIGTPMMNRPSSDAFDDELTLAALDPQPPHVAGPGGGLTHSHLAIVLHFTKGGQN